MAKTVLIVEDERAIVEILKFNLKREGYETLEALDGQTGLQLAQTEDPDLILLDVMLPKMNGFDICKTLRGENRTTPISARRPSIRLDIMPLRFRAGTNSNTSRTSRKWRTVAQRSNSILA